MFRRLRPLQLGVDIGIAVVFVLLALTGVLSGSGLFELAVLGVMGIALALRRLSPGLALAVAWVAAVLQMASMAQAPSFSDLAVLAVLYCTAAYGGRILRWAGLGSAIVGSMVATLYLTLLPALSQYPSQTSPNEVVRGALISFFGLLAVLGLSWTIGLLARTWRRARDSRRAQARAEQDVMVEQERNRIARDMHDVVAHSLAVVIAQADGARYAREKDPEAVDVALSAISTTAREALGDVRILLTQLRHSQGDGPQPAVADLGKLVDQLTDSGLDVHRIDHGDPVALPAGQQLALYRIVQEALINALRHGDLGAPVDLLLDWADPVAVTVSSGLGAGPANPGGHGLAGMRERAVLAGGSLTAGAEDSRWIVRATLPVVTA